MTASWLTADFAAGDSSLLRGLDADGSSLMGFLPAPSQLGGVFGLDNSWTLGLRRNTAEGASPVTESGPASFRGLAARLESREREQQEGGTPQWQSVTAEQQDTGAPRDGPAWRAADPPVRLPLPRCHRNHAAMLSDGLSTWCAGVSHALRIVRSYRLLLP